MPRHLAVTVALALCCACASACGKAENPGVDATGGTKSGPAAGRGGRGAGGPVPVTTALVQVKPMPVTIGSYGSAEAQQSVQVHAQVTGELSAVRFTEGQEVRKGDELFTLDPRPFQAALSQAQAVLARDTATATNAQASRARQEDLYKRQLISRDQYEAQIATSDAANATLEADRAAIDTAKLNLQYTHIMAPITGRTGSLGVHQGDLIRANDTTPMVIINQLSPIYVTFSVPGRYLGDVRRYQARSRSRARGQAALPPGARSRRRLRCSAACLRHPPRTRPRDRSPAPSASALQKAEASAGMTATPVYRTGRLLHRQRSRQHDGAIRVEGAVRQARATRSGPGSSSW
jgi:multidrug efflux pump subunit AcrA (membrane-fusion protein)